MYYKHFFSPTPVINKAWFGFFFF